MAGIVVASYVIVRPALASREPPDSTTLSGTWRWIRSFGGLLGANEMPGECGCERVLVLGPDGKYEYVERDSAHAYLLCSGLVTIHRYDEATAREGGGVGWLTLGDWWVSYERNMRVWFVGEDTLAAYPGSPSSGVDDALTHWFVRTNAAVGRPTARQQEERLPLSARPAREFVQLPGEGEFVYYEVEPRAIRRVAPEYPAFAKEAGIRGTVTLHALVGKDGRVRRVKVARGVTGLNEAAVFAVRQWSFSPALSNSKPVAVWFEVQVHFPP